MKVLQAGSHKFLYLDLDPEIVGDIFKQLGLEFRVRDGVRSIEIEFSAPGRQAPLLLFDASDPTNLGWFSRCQYYVDGSTAAVMQAPILVSNVRDRGGFMMPNALRLQVAKELPVGFRLPGRQPVTEQVVYVILYNFLGALLNSGVAICGGSLVRPLTGRMEAPRARR